MPHFNSIDHHTVAAVRPTRTHAVLHIADTAGYLAVWPAMYLLACAHLAADLSDGVRPTLIGSLMLVCLAMSVYLIDRVKLVDRALDPGDEATHPARHAWLWGRRRWVRRFTLLLSVVAAVAGATIDLRLVAAPLVGQIMVFLYSGRAPSPTRRPIRLKDLPLVKNLSAAAGLSCIAMLAVFESGGTQFQLGDLVPLSVLAVLVFADCAMCDVGDAPGDGAHGTNTLAVMFGPKSARLIASGLVIAVAAWVAWRHESWAWSVGLVVTQCGLLAIPAWFIRTATDLRLPILACGVWFIL